MLRDDAFEVVLARKLEKFFAFAFEVAGIQEPGATLRSDCSKTCLALNQRRIAQVITVTPQQVKRLEPRLTAAEYQFLKLRFALGVEANNLSVQHRSAIPEFVRQARGQS